MRFHRPVPQSDPIRPPDALPLAGGPFWFREVAIHALGEAPRLWPAAALDEATRARLSAPRAPVCGLPLDRPRIMGVVNVTPDSFSDGGRFETHDQAMAQAEALAEAGADILDIGGESTRPGADPVPVAEELRRVLPVIEGLRARGLGIPISVDTRNAAVARAALDAGADLLNDVSALLHDCGMAPLAAERAVPVCLMHAQGDPKTMQEAPSYRDVLVEVATFLRERVEAAEAQGIARGRVLVDPGIGFGKTLEHNLALVRGLAILHDIGCAILFGASRKRFIGTIAGVSRPSDRVAGSVAVALEALRQGAQVLRVHDVAETRQAAAILSALIAGSAPRDG